jgi:hypothetical protein
MIERNRGVVLADNGRQLRIFEKEEDSTGWLYSYNSVGELISDQEIDTKDMWLSWGSTNRMLEGGYRFLFPVELA